MKYPNKLKTKDKIYLVAPSFGCTFDPYLTRLDSAINYFKDKDYEIIEGENIRNFLICSSNTKEKRANEINEAFKSDARIVASVGGGEIMTDILEYVDFALISKNPKWFFGYSDNTNLTYLLPTIADVASIYSINFPSFGLNKLHKEAIDTLALLKGEINSTSTYEYYKKPTLNENQEHPLAEVITDTKTNIICVNSNSLLNEINNLKFKGRLLGGCLDILTTLVGTEFDKTLDFITRYQNDEIVFFFEACDLTPPGIYRSLTQLKRANWFKNTKNVIIGMPLAAYEQNFAEMDQYNAVTMALEGLDINIIFDVTIGHISPTMPIVTGALADFTYENNTLLIEYSEIEIN